MPSMPTWVPTRKVLTGGLAGIATWGICAVARRYGGLELPADSVGAVVAGVGSLSAYFMPPAARDLVGKADKVIEAVGDPTHAGLVTALIGATAGGPITIPAGVTLPIPLTLPSAPAPAAAPAPEALTMEGIAALIDAKVTQALRPAAPPLAAAPGAAAA